ncbi:unnamed protein product [Didymodactylos carnosus]|uniref:Uncharacterized protein n=1 Tax=Didymodactylos carnosus TaxID=1234261 RepID=A0A814W7T3_9BILA|nr:unnamed protein product [Didymodactylos carnosus]CAF1251045.1 unnamed protein product [Didymodactylos carnosus]CAF3965837.1 unnamed protein product [Didymodactylos carnosus]CAF4058381.1 unnamed protein product [Didymodactylos carnosus]
MDLWRPPEQALSTPANDPGITIDRSITPNKRDSAAVMMIHKIRNGISNDTVDGFCDLFNGMKTDNFCHSSDAVKRNLTSKHENFKKLQTEYSICEQCKLAVETKLAKRKLCSK